MPTGPSPAVLRDLLERVRVAKKADRRLDVRLLAGLLQVGQWSAADVEYACTDPRRTCDPQTYTASVDAALALVERVLPDDPGYEIIAFEDQTKGVQVCVGNAMEIAPTAPLAILAALISAKLALTQGADHAPE